MTAEEYYEAFCKTLKTAEVFSPSEQLLFKTLFLGGFAAGAIEAGKRVNKLGFETEASIKEVPRPQATN